MQVSKDALADVRMAWHLSALLKRELTGLLQHTRRKTDLADVVHESANVHELLLLRR